MYKNFYRPVFRPPGFATLPHGLRWEYIEVPLALAYNRPELPVSRYTYGIIATDRPLTAQERSTFDLAVWKG